MTKKTKKQTKNKEILTGKRLKISNGKKNRKKTKQKQCNFDRITTKN